MAFASVSRASIVQEPDSTGANRVPAIELRSVRKTYRIHDEVVEAVKKLNLSIGDSEFFSLLGPSGCGKTTIMRLIAGFESLDSGQMLLAGKDVAGTAPHLRDVNMVFQNYALFPHLNVWENIAFGLRRRKVPKDEIARRVGEMVEIVGLSGRERRKPRQMSGGQQQRVALARALVNRPAALLLDEPLGALDLQLRQGMQVELKRVQREVGIAFIYVTHDQNEAMAMSDRVAVMNEGNLEQLGTPFEIYERPTTEFVARFIGSSNVLRGSCVRNSAQGSRIELGGTNPLSVESNRGDGDSVSVTVRPERLKICRLGAGTPVNECVLPGRVLEGIYQGTGTTFTIDTGSQGVLTVSIPSDAGRTALPQRGEHVGIVVAPSAVHVIGPLATNLQGGGPA